MWSIALCLTLLALPYAVLLVLNARWWRKRRARHLDDEDRANAEALERFRAVNSVEVHLTTAETTESGWLAVGKWLRRERRRRPYQRRCFGFLYRADRERPRVEPMFLKGGPHGR